tara:strand:+ start:7379 stop:7654 length:276 start_codon:yes stop_codon:yes gene_type:complete
MKNIIKYKLEKNGTIPKYISDGGYYPNGKILIGVTVDNSKESGKGIIKSEKDLEIYLKSYTNTKKHYQRNNLNEIEPFNQKQHAKNIWNKK